MTPETPLDRGAVAVLDLLKRGWDTNQGEESFEEMVETVDSAIRSDGLAVVIRRQMDYETDFCGDAELDGLDPFPDDLAAIAADTPKTVWR